MKHNITINGVEIPDEIPNHVIRQALASLVPYFNGVVSDLMLQCGRESPIGGWVSGAGSTTTIEREKPQPSPPGPFRPRYEGRLGPVS